MKSNYNWVRSSGSQLLSGKVSNWKNIFKGMHYISSKKATVLNWRGRKFIQLCPHPPHHECIHSYLRFYIETFSSEIIKLVSCWDENNGEFASLIHFISFYRYVHCSCLAGLKESLLLSDPLYSYLIAKTEEPPRVFSGCCTVIYSVGCLLLHHQPSNQGREERGERGDVATN